MKRCFCALARRSTHSARISDPPLLPVIVSGSNPKDWKAGAMRGLELNTGDDIAGTVHSVGADVTGFHPGDRVMAFHVMRDPHGSYAEYAVAPAHTTAHLPASVSYEEGAAIPLAALTAAVGLFVRLELPAPWNGGAQDGFAAKDENTAVSKSGFGVGGKPLQRAGPVVVYGAATAVGAYAIQLCKRAGIGPLICIAGRGIPFVEGLIDKKAGDVIIDYRQGDDAVVAGIKAALKPGEELKYCFDAVAEHNSAQNVCKVMTASGARITGVLPYPEGSWLPSGVQTSLTMVGDVHGLQTDFGAAAFLLLAKGLQEGWFKAHPQTVVPGGLAGVQGALADLKAGKASATKYVFRIADTPGIGQ